MQNRYWRWVGMFLICVVAFGIGWSYGFVRGGEETFDFFMGFLSYSVENGVLKMEVDTERLETYIKLAQKYCWKNSQGSGSTSAGIDEMDCGEGY